MLTIPAIRGLQTTPVLPTAASTILTTEVTCEHHHEDTAKYQSCHSRITDLMLDSRLKTIYLG